MRLFGPARGGPVQPFPVQMVTIPRSGHHLLVRLLRAARPVRYCGFYRPRECCRQIPCVAGMELQRTHDFAGRTPRIETLRYLIQVRDIVPALVSGFELHAQRHPDTRGEWERFALKRLERHRRPFVRKWLRSPPPHSMVVHYDDLVTDTADTFRRVAEFVWGAPADLPESAEAIREPRRVEAFRHYDDEFFAMLERRAARDNRMINAFRRARSAAGETKPRRTASWWRLRAPREQD